MSVEGWILMVGLRVVDLGALVVWLVWFYRQCDKDDDDSDGEDFRRGDTEPDGPPEPTGGPGIGAPLPDAGPWPTRRRGHDDVEWPPSRAPRRAPEPHPVPARVVEPGEPAPRRG